MFGTSVLQKNLNFVVKHKQLVDSDSEPGSRQKPNQTEAEAGAIPVLRQLQRVKTPLHRVLKPLADMKAQSHTDKHTVRLHRWFEVKILHAGKSSSYREKRRKSHGSVDALKNQTVAGSKLAEKITLNLFFFKKENEDRWSVWFYQLLLHRNIIKFTHMITVD